MNLLQFNFANKMTDIVHSIYAYDGDNGFKFRAGEKILVKERGENGWWRGTLLNQGDSTNGEIEEKEGWFPSSYVEGAGNININTQVNALYIGSATVLSNILMI